MDRPVTEPDAVTGPAADLDASALPEASVRRRNRRQSSTRQAIEWVALLGGALLIALLIKAFLFQAFYIPSPSMTPTLKVNDRVLVNKLSYRLHDVHRGDIVVFEAPKGEERNGVKDFVKRVVGLPGETIEGHDGHVYIDGRRLDEPYLPKDRKSVTFGPEKVPPESLFVLGDNRLESRDSTVFGPIPEDSVVGRVFVRIWPVSRLGFL